MTPSLIQIDNLLANTGLSFALFLSKNQLVLANSLFIKQWDLYRISFPKYSLSDFGNKNAAHLIGETKGQFWYWFTDKNPNPSLMVLPDVLSDRQRFLLKVPTEQESAGDPFFLEKNAEEFSEELKEGLLLLGRRIRNPAGTIVRSFRDALILGDFFENILDQDSNAVNAEIILVKEPAWKPGASFWRVNRSKDAPGKLKAIDLDPGEGTGLVPFRRILYSKSPGQGYWADFPLLFDGAFFGKIRLFRPESRKKELPGLNRFQKTAQTLSGLLFNVRKNLGDLSPMEREPETGFLSRKDSLRFLETLIGEHQVSQTGFGLVGLKIDLQNHREILSKIRKIMRYYDEIGHLTPREYLLILPAMRPDALKLFVDRVRDALLGSNPDYGSLLSFGMLSFPESQKGPMNLIRSVFLREESQPIQKSP